MRIRGTAIILAACLAGYLTVAASSVASTSTSTTGGASNSGSSSSSSGSASGRTSSSGSADTTSIDLTSPLGSTSSSGPTVTIDYGHSATLSTTLTDTTTGDPIVGATMTLWSRIHDKTPYHQVGSTTTDSEGLAAASVSPLVNTSYLWRFAGSTGEGGSQSLPQLVEVRIVVSEHVVPGSTAGNFTFFGGTAPGLAGSWVYLQVKGVHVWHDVGPKAELVVQNLPTGHKLGYLLRFTPVSGTTYRVYHAATASNAAGASVPNTVVVRAH